ncbi:MAG: hypothetical protein WD967_02195, partial [Candidatus Levyibacteriota bacterium]
TPPVEPVKGEPEPTESLRKHTHRLAAYCTHPSNISFENQEPDEEILLFLRRHFITSVPWILLTALLIFIPPLLAILLSTVNISSFAIPGEFILIITIFYYLAIVMYVFVQFIGWFYDIGIVTQKRVIDLDYSDIIHHDVAVTKLSLIQDINYIQTGLLRSFFNFGNVFLQTAGNNPNFDFLGIPKPGNAVHLIQDLIGKGPHEDA